MCISYKCLFFVIFAGFCNSARILGIFNFASYSHQMIFQPIYRELSLRGHNVTVFTTNPINDPTLTNLTKMGHPCTTNPINDPTLTNLTEVDLSYLYKYKIEEMPKNTFFGMRLFGAKLADHFMTDMLEDDRFKKVHQDANETFDVLLIDGYSQFYQALGYKFDVPEISIFTLGPYMESHSALGSFMHPVIYGGTLLEIEYPISIWQKLYNSYIFVANKWYYYYRILPMMDKTLKKYFGEDFPRLESIEKNISMAIINENKFMGFARPQAPNVVKIEFVHIKPPKALPQDLEDIMNKSSQGVVYFSLGSNVKSASLPLQVINEIIAGLSALPYTVLWKWESDEVPAVGKNVITRKWFPQQDILAHPNIKVFVTQGGLQSVEEAIARAVPIVGIPVIADQTNNIEKTVKLGIAVKLLLHEVNRNSLKEAISEVAENSRYQKKVNELRKIAFDEPMTGLEKAVWWIEYMIRHKSVPHFRSAIADIPLYEYLMLDVIIVVLGIILLTTFILKVLFNLLFRTVYKSDLKSKSE